MKGSAVRFIPGVLAFGLAMPALAADDPPGASSPAPPPSPPRVVETVRVPPPVIVGARPASPANLALTVRWGRQILWSGTLRVSGNHMSATYSQSKNESLPACPGSEPDRAGYGRASEQLSVRADRRRAVDTGAEGFLIDVNWTRPLPDCQGEGASTVGMSRIVPLAPGRTATLKGDGDLVVDVRRED